MKKTYKKPYIAVESFQLDAAIAASCSSEGKAALNYVIATCKDYTDYAVLGYFGNSCTHNVMDEGDGNDWICYHGPQVKADDAFMNS